MKNLKQNQLLKEIVTFINESLKKNKITEESNNTKSSIYTKTNLSKLKSIWPLKRGSVDKDILAWNFYENNEDVINAYLAYVIKNLSVNLLDRNFIFAENIKTIHDIFFNEYATSLFWDDIKKYYQHASSVGRDNFENRRTAVEKIIPKNGMVILCIDASFFRLRSGMNQELSSFEFFIEDVYNSNCSLISFARQNLLPKQKNSLRVNNYSISFKMNKDLIKTTIYEAMEPQSHLLQGNRFIEPNKTGCFDRLIHILSLGQNKIEDIQEKYIKLVV
jgi:hypothetical protein